MKSFEDFWNENVIPKLDDVGKDLVIESKDLHSTTEVMATLLVKYTKTLLAEYHAWLSSEILQIRPDHLDSEE